MPCYDPRNEVSTTKEVEAMLCALFKALGEENALALLCNPIALAIHGVPYAYVKSWWEGHKIRDQKQTDTSGLPG